MLVCQLIHALTVIQRDPDAQGTDWWDTKIFRLIHWLSAWGAQGIGDDDVLERLQSHTVGDDAMRKLAMAAVAMTARDRGSAPPLQ